MDVMTGSLAPSVMCRRNGQGQGRPTWETKVPSVCAFVFQETKVLSERRLRGCLSLYLFFYTHVGSYLSFVCAHLTAFEGKLARRLADYKHIVGTLLFPPTSPESKAPTTIYSTSHLFFLGDLNFRLAIPPSHPLSSFHKRNDAAQVLSEESFRQQVKEFDELHLVLRKGNALVGLHEGDFWKFKCSYKYQVGEVDKYR